MNAFALPNGTIYMQTGLVVKMENEAQLATLLEHEMVHFVNRHALKEMRKTENKKAFLEAMKVLLITTGYGAIIALAFSNQGELWTLASLRGYSRELETEADEEGLKAMIRAGYDPEQAPKAFTHLMDEIDENKNKGSLMYATHPRLQERIKNYGEFIRKISPPTPEKTSLEISTEFENKIEQYLSGRF